MHLYWHAPSVTFVIAALVGTDAWDDLGVTLAFFSSAPLAHDPGRVLWPPRWEQARDG